MKTRGLSAIYISISLLITFSLIFVITTPVMAAEQPRHGGILKVITTGGVMNLGDPGQGAGFNDGSYRMPVVEELLKFDFEGKGKIIPWLATDWNYSSDFKSLTMNLRKGVKFHDGTDFNAAAAKFSMDLLRESRKVQLKSVSSIDVIDDYTIRLNLKVYDCGLLSGIASYECPIISPTAYKSGGGGENAKFNPVGTGPFKFVSYDRDVLLRFAKFDDYWQKGKPYLDGIDFIFIADSVTRLASLKAGEAHVLRIITPSDGASLKASGKFTLHPNPMAIDGVIGDSIYPESPFHNVKVRQAIAYAIDNEAVAKGCGFGFFQPANQFISPDNLGYNPNIKGYPYNPKKAKALLKEAGYPKGFITKLTYRPGAFEADYCTMIQGYLAQVGINAKLNPADPGLFSKLRREGWKDTLMLYTFPTGPEKEMSLFMRDRLSSMAATYRKSVFIPKDYDEKLMKISSVHDEAKRKMMLQEVGRIAVDDYCLAIPVQIEMAVSAQNLQVRDLNLYKYYGMNWHPADAWLAE